MKNLSVLAFTDARGGLASEWDEHIYFEGRSCGGVMSWPNWEKQLMLVCISYRASRSPWMKKHAHAIFDCL
jgi:hypothetical protein